VVFGSWKEQWLEGGKFPFTPSVSDVHGVEAACDQLLEEGLDASIERHELAAPAEGEGGGEERDGRDPLRRGGEHDLDRQARLGLVGTERAGHGHDVRGRRDVVEVELADLVDVLEHVRELDPHLLDFRFAQLQPSETGNV